MGPAFLTTLLWSYCVIAARQSVNQLGENLANLLRLLVAVVVLGLVAHLWGMGWGGGGLFFFFMSGAVGFGFGDIGVFYALPRLGSRLTLLMAQCLAAPVAGVLEWWWLGTTLGVGQMIAVSIILVGIVVALAPKSIPAGSLPAFMAGIAFGVLAALGQGMGAVLSRKAYAAAGEAGNWASGQGVGESLLMGATTGYQRLLGGLLIVGLFFALSLVYRPWKTAARAPFGEDTRTAKARAVLLNAAAGPILGIICFQWALATTPSAIVQPIVAMTPLVVMPMSYFLEGDRPTRRGVIGALVSVVGVIVLAVV